LQPVAHCIVFHEGLKGEVEVMGLDRARGGGKGEHEIHRGDDFKGPAITMALHAGDPLRIDHARPHHMGNLFLKRPHQRALGARMVVVIGSGLVARQALGGGR
jgi:hypothetical protein